ncbi:MAG: ATP-binding protein [Dehalococcoidia bacterium]|nr:ATP-binding protein [Dehalococcoidia bacterium]
MTTIQELAAQNPWWRDPNAIEQDPKLVQLRAQPFQRRPSMLDAFRLDQPNVYTLRGPRQVGKSTTTKELIRNLIQTGFLPRRILYASMELERNPKALRDTVLRAKAQFPGEHSPWVIFIDELSWVRDWQTALLYLREHTDAANDCFVLTGSSAVDLRGGAERLPGRRGQAQDLDKLLLPLSFREFCQAIGLSAKLPIVGINEIAVGEDTTPIRNAMLYLDELQAALDNYLEVGGFPAAVADFLRTGSVIDTTIRTLWDIFAGDVGRGGRDRNTALKLLERVVLNLGSPSSWNALAEEMAVGKEHTAKEYADVLADSFLLLVVHFLDLAKRSPAPKKGKKLYPTDPLLWRLPGYVRPGQQSPTTSHTIEAVLAMALFRAREAHLQESFSVPQSLYYWRTNSHKEIDFLVGQPPKVVCVESKYATRIDGDMKKIVRNSFGKGLIVSRDTLELDDTVRVVPVAVVLYLLP